jgi:hypothetical protein
MMNEKLTALVLKLFQRGLDLKHCKITFSIAHGKLVDVEFIHKSDREEIDAAQKN